TRLHDGVNSGTRADVPVARLSVPRVACALMPEVIPYEAVAVEPQVCITVGLQVRPVFARFVCLGHQYGELKHDLTVLRRSFAVKRSRHMQTQRLRRYEFLGGRVHVQGQLPGLVLALLLLEEVLESLEQVV